MVRSRLLAAVLVLAAPLAARAADAPHEDGAVCSNCHLGHAAEGGALTKVHGNFNLCQSCHLNALGRPGVSGWSTAIQAVPGSAGRSHSWSGDAASFDATPPSTSSADPGEIEMAKRLDGTTLQCSTCHDAHQSDLVPQGGRGTQHVSTPARAGTPGSTGDVTVSGVTATAAARAYRIEITQAGNETSARFRLSNDKGASWFGCSGPGTYVAYVASPSNACTAAAAVQLNDGANVTVAFGTGSYVAGARWDLWVSYPFLRADNTDAKMCVTCHRDRNQSHQNVRGSGPIVGTGAPIVLGVTQFSHPVGEGLNANGTGTDHGTPLDANGATQVVGDGNQTNDLVLSSTKVTCLTCHRPHNADSNSLSEDDR
jgi:hypothetical protein